MVKFNFNFRFYKQSQFWSDFIVVLSLLVGRKKIFSSDPVIKYTLLISMAVLIVSLVKQVFFYREEQ